jgi:hypothetical protein
MMIDVMFRPDIFKTAMDFVVGNMDPPSHRIGGNEKWRVFRDSVRRHTKLIGFPRFNLRFWCSRYNSRDRNE